MCVCFSFGGMIGGAVMTSSMDNVVCTQGWLRKFTGRKLRASELARD